MSDRHTIQPYPIRMSPDLRSRLEVQAANGGRSLHAEVIRRLEQTFAMDKNVAEAEQAIASLLEERPPQTQAERVEEWAASAIRIQDQIELLMDRQKMYLRWIEKHRQADPTKESS